MLLFLAHGQVGQGVTSDARVTTLLFLAHDLAGQVVAPKCTGHDTPVFWPMVRHGSVLFPVAQVTMLLFLSHGQSGRVSLPGARDIE